MNDQLRLLDADRTIATACPVPHCGALRLPGQTQPILTCAHDLEREHGRTRPKHCLNRVDPAHTDWGGF